MQVYRVINIENEEAKPKFKGTRDEAHTEAKGFFQKENARIELVDVKLDKEMVVQILNGGDPGGDILRTWALTNRGGLKEVPNGE